MTDLSIFRTYEPDELGADGYPRAWHRLGENVEGVKDLVRQAAGHRCVRCQHPYIAGRFTTDSDGLQGSAASLPNAVLFAEDVDVSDIQMVKNSKPGINWSRCDDRCDHKGPARVRDIHGKWIHYGPDDDLGPLFVFNEVQAAWRILTVHHLNGRKHDLRWWNLVALCQRCHLAIQGKVQMERVFPLEHTEWFRPHAAGWYAYSYLGENLTREQVEERQDALLALERLA